MRKPISTNRPPTGGKMWTWKCPETGYEITHRHYDQVKERVRLYCQRNNFPIGLQWDDQFDENLCANAPANSCEEFGQAKITKKALQLVRALGVWASQGFPTRSQEEVTKILDVCKTCEFYTGESSILKIACKRCGCTSK